MNELLRFARLHDWGYDAAIVAGGIKVGVEVHHADGTWTREYSVLPNMAALRAWAGY